jgi:hypothetical protein
MGKYRKIIRIGVFKFLFSTLILLFFNWNFFTATHSWIGGSSTNAGPAGNANATSTAAGGEIVTQTALQFFNPHCHPNKKTPGQLYLNCLPPIIVMRVTKNSDEGHQKTTSLRGSIYVKKRVERPESIVNLIMKTYDYEKA